MSASTDSRLRFKVLSDTFGPVKVKQEHPELFQNDTDIDFDTLTSRNTNANSGFVNGIDVPDSDVRRLGHTHVAKDTGDASNLLRDTCTSNAPNTFTASSNQTGDIGFIERHYDDVVNSVEQSGVTNANDDDANALRNTGVFSGTTKDNDDAGDILRRTGGWGSGVSNPVFQTGDAEGSSSHSSLAELTAAQDRGIRTSFREQQNGFPSNAYQADVTSVKTAEVHVRSVPGDIEDETPASVNVPSAPSVHQPTDQSTASSTARFFLGGSGPPREYNVGNIHQNSNLDKTMREKIRRENSAATDMGTLKTSAANGGFVVTGKEKSPYPRDNEIFMKEKQTHCCPKLTAFLLVIVVIVAGIFVTVYFLKEDEPDKQTGAVIKEPDEKPEEKMCDIIDVKLRDKITMTCPITADTFLVPKKLKMIPPAYVNKGDPIMIGLNPKTSYLGWSADFDVTRQKLVVNGPDALCSSTGIYQMALLNSLNTTVYKANVQINVLSEISKVNVSLTQSVTDNTTDFKVACQTNSGCEQSFVDFFADINKDETYLRGVNFTCMVTYNDYDGYSVSCTGVIPDFLMAQFGRITCRPRSRLLDDLDEDELEELAEYLELPECDISKHCGFKCTEEGDYYKVNPGRCDIFHRCFGRTVYTSYCAPGTFFDPFKCTCEHTTQLKWCQDNGAVKPMTEASKKTCTSDV